MPTPPGIDHPPFVEQLLAHAPDFAIELSHEEVAIVRAWVDVWGNFSLVEHEPAREFAGVWRCLDARRRVETCFLRSVLRFNEVLAKGQSSVAESLDDGWFSASELAAKYAIPDGRRDAFDTALRRYRRSCFEGWEERSTPRRNEARFVYNARAVGHIIEEYRKRN